ncbi:Hypothetical predicted protein [Pelobates cultripes]|uniref:Uncharacterized protein n=1 Tax=Pelobates cultripes TaxID=61616 RepID=A0AAD1RAD8_PELCU|nr:Hypothetical predicted protein [Pelobates cultripes]
MAARRMFAPGLLAARVIFNHSLPTPQQTFRCSGGTSNYSQPKGDGSLYALIVGITALGAGVYVYITLYKDRDRFKERIVSVSTSFEGKHEDLKTTGSKEDATQTVKKADSQGTASFATARSIRARDPGSRVLIISEELDLPYMLPPFSKELWFSDDPDVSETLRLKQ